MRSQSPPVGVESGKSSSSLSESAESARPWNLPEVVLVLTSKGCDKFDRRSSTHDGSFSSSFVGVRVGDRREVDDGCCGLADDDEEDVEIGCKLGVEVEPDDVLIGVKCLDAREAPTSALTTEGTRCGV
jgi:hypothetical protein